jgi:hypothetical protein
MMQLRFQLQVLVAAFCHQPPPTRQPFEGFQVLSKEFYCIKIKTLNDVVASQAQQGSSHPNPDELSCCKSEK